MKRLIVVALVVVLVTIMSAPAALFATGGGGGGNGDCKGKDKRGGKCEYPKVKICHKPNTPAAKILRVPQSAVNGHLGHGDFVIDKDHPAKDCKKKKNNNGGHHNGGHGKK